VSAPPTRMTVEAGKVREFAAAIGSDHPAYVGAIPTSSPATFLITKRFWQPADADPFAGLDFDRRRMLHAEEGYEFFGPPPGPGTVLEATSTLEDELIKTNRHGDRMRFATVVTDFTDERGVLRARSRTTVVETPARPEGGG